MNVDEKDRALEIIKKYVFNPEHYWPKDIHFHRRNIQKITSSVGSIDKSKQAYHASIILEELEARNRAATPSLFITSCGASGCHFAGSILGDLKDFSFIKEVYFPNCLIEEALSFADMKYGQLLFDLVGYIHTQRSATTNERTIPVNIMHHRQDTDINTLRALCKRASFFLLLRNPYDIAISRAFRKQDYKNIVSPESDEFDYLNTQSKNVGSFFSQIEATKYDGIIRYEQLVNDPCWTLGDALKLADINFNSELLKTSSKKYSKDSKNVVFSNYNNAEKLYIKEPFSSILFKHLDEVAKRWQYEVPNNVDIICGRQTDSDKLWNPMRTSLYRKSYADQLQKGEVVMSAGMPAIKEEKLLDLKHIESHPKSLQLYFHSLCWLYIFEHDFNSNKNQGSLDKITNTIVSFLEMSLKTHNTPAMFWDDHASSFRLATISYFYSKHKKSIFQENTTKLLTSSVKAHITKIEEFIDSKKWTNNNHAIFHALSIINAYLTFGARIVPETVFEKAKKSLHDTITSIVDIELGVSLEQSPHYHVWIIKTIAEANSFLANNEINLSINLNEVLSKMLAFSRLLIQNDEGLPALGDTPFRNSYTLANIEQLERDLAEAPYHMDLSSKGLFLLDDKVNFFDFQKAGYLLLRRKSAESLLTILKCDSKNLSHGHHDCLSVYCKFNGLDLFTDSGGPFQYGNQNRFKYFMQNHAHNVVRIDKKTYEGGASFLWQKELKDAHAVTAEIENNNGVNHQRLVVQTIEGELIIVDRLSSLNDKEFSHETFFHLNPNSTVKIESPDTYIADQHRVSHVSTAPFTSMIIEAQHTPYLQGWITERQSEMKPAPVMCYAGKSTLAINVTVLHKNDTEALPIKILTDKKKVTIEIQSKNTIHINYSKDLSLDP